MNSVTPKAAYNFMICHSMGWEPISTMGLGRVFDSSDMRVPLPPARITHFMLAGPAARNTVQFVPESTSACLLPARRPDTNPPSMPPRVLDPDSDASQATFPPA